MTVVGAASRQRAGPTPGVMAALAVFILWVLAAPAYAKPKITINSVLPEKQTDSCLPKNAQGCRIYLGPRSGNVTLSWQADQGSDKANYRVVYDTQNSVTCDTGKLYPDVENNKPYREKDTNIQIELKRETVDGLPFAQSTATSVGDKTFYFKLCFDAVEQPPQTQSTGTQTTNQPSATAAAENREDFLFTVVYDEASPAPPTDIQVEGLHKTLVAKWIQSPTDDVSTYEVQVDTQCHDSHSKEKETLKKWIADRKYSQGQQGKLVDALDQCQPTEGSPSTVEADSSATEKDITKFNDKELDNSTVYFIEVFALDRVGNEGGPVPGIGMPNPAIGPRTIFSGDREMGCSVMPPLSRAGGVGDWSWLAFVPVLIARRRKP